MSLIPSAAMIYVAHCGMFLSLAGLVYAGRSSVARYLDNWLQARTNDGERSEELLILGSGIGMGIIIVLTFIGVPLFAAIAGALVGAVLGPRHIIKKRIEKYQVAFDASLCDALTTIASSLKAGLTLQEALNVAANNTAPVFANVVAGLLKRYRFGMPIEQALDRARDEVGTASANISFGAMIIASQLGGNLPDTLHRIEVTIRERHKVEGKLRSLTAQGRMQAFLLCSAPPLLGVGMYIWDPTRMQLLTQTLPGQVLMCLAIILEVIGIVVTRRIMQLDI